MLSIKQLQRASPVRRPVVTVGQLADRDPALAVRGDRSGRPVGVLSITDVEREVRARHLVHGNGRRDGIT
jgi:hypothetical protein